MNIHWTSLLAINLVMIAWIIKSDLTNNSAKGSQQSLKFFYVQLESTIPSFKQVNLSKHLDCSS